MIERPIIFSAPMVSAILEGRKTQTRRIMKPAFGKKYPILNLAEHGHFDNGYSGEFNDPASWGYPFAEDGEDMSLAVWPELCPYGVSQERDVYNIRGSRLWVRENYYLARRYSYGTYPSGEPMEEPKPKYCKGDPVHYSADGVPENTPNASYPSGLRNGLYAAPDPYAIWRHFPSIHMPRWASRIDLIIKGVRAERLQDISDKDAIAEGIQVGEPMPDIAPGSTGNIYHNGVTDPIDGWTRSPREAFMDLWIAINGRESWFENPWVWVIDFERIKP